jgi:transcriptional regulator with XRE-family HTH domain
MPGSSARLAPVIAPKVETHGRTSGEILRTVREQRHLTLRQVTEATRRIAITHHHEEFSMSSGRLSEVENKGVVPNIFKLYSLSIAYDVDLREMLSWFGIPRN